MEMVTTSLQPIPLRLCVSPNVHTRFRTGEPTLRSPWMRGIGAHLHAFIVQSRPSPNGCSAVSRWRQRQLQCRGRNRSRSRIKSIRTGGQAGHVSPGARRRLERPLRCPRRMRVRHWRRLHAQRRAQLHGGLLSRPSAPPTRRQHPILPTCLRPLQRRMLPRCAVPRTRRRRGGPPPRGVGG